MLFLCIFQEVMTTSNSTFLRASCLARMQTLWFKKRSVDEHDELEIGKTNAGAAMVYVTKEQSGAAVSEMPCRVEKLTLPLSRHCSAGTPSVALANTCEANLWEMAITSECWSSSSKRVSISSWMFQLLTILFGHLRKTTFAKCLPCPLSYFRTLWYNNNWLPGTRCVVVDNVPWNRYKKWDFPD